MYTATFYEPRQKCRFRYFQVRCAHTSDDVLNFIIVTCRISSQLKCYTNYKNQLRFAKVIVRNKMSRFLMVHYFWSKKSDITVVLLDRDFLKDAEISAVWRK